MQVNEAHYSLNLNKPKYFLNYKVKRKSREAFDHDEFDDEILIGHFIACIRYPTGSGISHQILLISNTAPAVEI